MNRLSEERAECRISIVESWDNEHAVIETRDFARSLSFGVADQMLLATAASELCMNILRYAGRGELCLSEIRREGRQGMEILAVDKGPGIPDVEKAMQEHFTTTKGSLGLGLPSVRRIMDDFEIVSSPENGTRVRACKWKVCRES